MFWANYCKISSTDSNKGIGFANRYKKSVFPIWKVVDTKCINAQLADPDRKILFVSKQKAVLSNKIKKPFFHYNIRLEKDGYHVYLGEDWMVCIWEVREKDLYGAPSERNVPPLLDAIFLKV